MSASRKKILFCPDSFKESITALEICSLAEHLGCNYPIELTCLPLADGGEGTTTTIATALQMNTHTVDAFDPLGRPIQAQIAYDATSKLVVMEMAAAGGLGLLQPSERNPFVTSTYGVGTMIRNALSLGPKTILIGIGGSGTNDGASGLLMALGAKFYDKKGNPVPLGAKGLLHLEHIDLTPALGTLNGVEIKVAFDVLNPLLGENGASMIYGKQKGAGADDLPALDACLAHYHSVVLREQSVDYSCVPGAGAAGGMGYGLLTIGAKMHQGFPMIADIYNISSHIQQADLVIAGEGAVDGQSLQGKPLGHLATVCQSHNKPLWVVCGRCDLSLSEQKALGIERVFQIKQPSMSVAQAIAETPNRLRDIFTGIFAELDSLL